MFRHKKSLTIGQLFRSAAKGIAQSCLSLVNTLNTAVRLMIQNYFPCGIVSLLLHSLEQIAERFLHPRGIGIKDIKDYEIEINIENGIVVR